MLPFKKNRSFAIICMSFCFFAICIGSVFGQSISINGAGTGRTFDGVGGVSGGGATSVLLMSYPEPYRSQILDYLFKPNFGASIQTAFCEIGGDCNSTQGSELSHMHTSSDENYQRGYEWWLMKEAYARNPNITFDGVAWGCPSWVGGGNFWSTDMQNYYIKWIKGLKSSYGIDLDAIGCRNESGSNTSWLIQFKNALTAAGLTKVRVHGMDDWNGVTAKWGTADQLSSNAQLKAAIDVLSAHTTVNTTWSETKVDATANAVNSGKPLWDTEEHYMTGGSAMNNGYKQATAEVQAFNQNYIRSKVTKTLFWYLACCTYPMEPWGDYGCINAYQPWGGYYQIKEGVWGYAHYNQFVKIGWQFIDGACGNINGNASNGSYVTLKSPGNTDFSVIIETKYASSSQTLTFAVSGGLPTNKPLCVWRSTGSNDIFVKQADIPAGATFSISVNANSIYSISTTTGQQKGSFTNVPVSSKFPFPYYENYEHYKTTASDQKLWGYVPYYQADIVGGFEIFNRPDGTGKCLRQVLNTKAQSWANEWAPYSIIGDQTWTDYEVSADISFDGTSGWAGIMARVNYAGDGYYAFPKGYYFRLAPSGAWALMAATSTTSSVAGTSLASGTATLSGQWHNVKLQCSGGTLTGYIENNKVCTQSNSSFSSGCVGFCTGDPSGSRNTALFDNLIVDKVGGTSGLAPTTFQQDAYPPYSFIPVGIAAQPMGKRMVQALTSYKVVGDQFLVPKELAGKKISAAVFDLKGKLLHRATIEGSYIKLRNNYGKSDEVFIVKLKVLE
jgi:galactosylceramidase